MDGEFHCPNEAVYGEYCEECLDNKIDFLRKSIYNTGNKLYEMQTEIHNLFALKFSKKKRNK